MSWESPIDLYVSDVQNKFEENVLKAVQSVGIQVDRDELIKALAYDRNQYEKGYIDRDNEIIRCKDCKHWKTITRAMDFGMCDHFCRNNFSCNDYCSFAERRECYEFCV